VKQSFSKTWESLISYASKTFFSIENFEKDSGLLILSFGVGDASRFVDCGYYSGGPTGFSGPYVRYLQQGASATLQGKMNLRVRTINPEETEVSVNARYIFVRPPSQASVLVPNYLTGTFQTQYVTIPGTTWTFDSKSVDTQMVANVSAGTEPTRTCQPTGTAESEILKGVEESN
jgi:hypothetical protein